MVWPQCVEEISVDLILYIQYTGRLGLRWTDNTNDGITRLGLNTRGAKNGDLSFICTHCQKTDDDDALKAKFCELVLAPENF